MPYKPGGGNKPELYDPDTGEYTEEDKRIINKRNLESLVMHYLFGMKEEKAAFPDYRFNDREYCELYVDYLKEISFNKEIDSRKAKYLLTYSAKGDKSLFLKNKLGYNEEKLLNDIYSNTDFRTMMFSELTEYGLKVIACTKLKSQIEGKIYYATSVWQFTSPKNARFITLIPGEKIWDLIYLKK